nr:MAG TPA: hypothetical protein [Caudoviricetes sp.]
MAVGLLLCSRIYFLPLPGVVFVEFLPRRSRLITSFFPDARTPHCNAARPARVEEFEVYHGAQ